MATAKPGPIQGRCLCGAVTVEVDHLADTISACHCTPCRRWSGSAMLVIEGRGVRATGPVKTYASSSFATRAWCDVCGSNLWIRDNGSEVTDLMPGLFENFAGAHLAREVYADRCPPGLAFAGDHPRISAEAYEAEHMHTTGETP
ncbi:MAG: GFA family protein [Pseudomonadota bacterium]